MISLISKQSNQIKIVTAQRTTALAGPFDLLIETGVAAISFGGSNPHDWTRDTLSFPVGEKINAHQFVSGIASAGPASFWANPPLLSLGVGIGDLSGSGTDSQGNSIFIEVGQAVTGVGLEGNVVGLGCAVDSATVAYSGPSGQPVLNLALAVFGQSTFLQRVSYWVFLYINENSTLAGGGPGTTGGVLTEK